MPWWAWTIIIVISLIFVIGAFSGGNSRDWHRSIVSKIADWMN